MFYVLRNEKAKLSDWEWRSQGYQPEYILNWQYPDQMRDPVIKRALRERERAAKAIDARMKILAKQETGA